MARFLQITFMFSDGPPKTTELEPIFNFISEDWCRFSPTAWLVWTARPASDFFYALKPSLGPRDSMLIIGVDMNDRNGWMPQWIWEWMDRRRQLAPPPPPAPPPPDYSNLLRALGGEPPFN